MPSFFKSKGKLFGRLKFWDKGSSSRQKSKDKNKQEKNSSCTTVIVPDEKQQNKNTIEPDNTIKYVENSTILLDKQTSWDTDIDDNNNLGLKHTNKVSIASIQSAIINIHVSNCNWKKVFY